MCIRDSSIYSVISPEGCASILWKKQEKSSEAAEKLGITAQRLKELNLTDSIIPEPLGGAQRDIPQTMNNVKTAIKRELDKIVKQPLDILLESRYLKLMSYGQVAKSGS